MDANFMDLVLWILSPLLVLFALWALCDCARDSKESVLSRCGFAVIIVLIPIWGGVLWFRHKEVRRSGDSALMTRVRKRRSGGRPEGS